MRGKARGENGGRRVLEKSRSGSRNGQVRCAEEEVSDKYKEYKV